MASGGTKQSAAQMQHLDVASRHCKHTLSPCHLCYIQSSRPALSRGRPSPIKRKTYENTVIRTSKHCSVCLQMRRLDRFESGATSARLAGWLAKCEREISIASFVISFDPRLYKAAH